MKIKELIETLKGFDPELEVVYPMHSDYNMLDPELIGVANLVDQDGYVMRAHRSMSEENKSRAKKYLCLPLD